MGASDTLMFTEIDETSFMMKFQDFFRKFLPNIKWATMNRERIANDPNNPNYLALGTIIHTLPKHYILVKFNEGAERFDQLCQKIAEIYGSESFVSKDQKRFQLLIHTRIRYDFISLICNDPHESFSEEEYKLRTERINEARAKFNEITENLRPKVVNNNQYFFYHLNMTRDEIKRKLYYSSFSTVDYFANVFGQVIEIHGKSLTTALVHVANKLKCDDLKHVQLIELID